MYQSLVFVTGSTGFIGSQVVAATLRAGYRVRLSIRKPEQEAALKARYAELSDKIEICIIPDLSRPGAFDDALVGVDYVFHIASPMPGKGTDIKRDYVDPAVQATTSILQAALTFKQVKKVVIVSSILALAPLNAIITNSVDVKENTGQVIPVDLSMDFPEGFVGEVLKYSASKILAHQATRDFLAANSPHYSVITLHPVFVLGDSMIQQTASELDSINGLFWKSLFTEKPQLSSTWVHVRDVADAHVKVLETDVKSGTEFILSRPATSWEEVASFVKSKYPALGCQLQPPFESGWTVETTGAEQNLGIKWRSEWEIVEDVVNQQLALQAKASSL
ncbi:dihydroflavonal-4-reductase [Penicillium canariense]|uniref:Dihydroflavonal-4-reductase n=1 Tax=Penicillium canariense TaxID=189055 RepID=A0A9W9LLV8_9EURO|nr:dihydroflavonal-4-reductase [Penicillium canariense]KAJ5166299.1 dihydroflavonal-4-reductase [Penicillium canariense]